ncbi:1-acyl-sn-glycerol-3-phosphate acyltransferase [Flavobacterium sp.]|uniref:1-acyl-sn-glycerol-3-phosphate acyltransferase n=1 Tax=Flavobacterium sp. TaxID=239 RepID=UPI0025E12077|nr:1-acyl-sn-glycerol-3-phosphate acyltransferase [Flavobacterium sp.]
MQDLFSFIYTYLNKRKIFSVVVFSGILFILWVFATRIQLSEDITRLIPINDKTNTTAKVLNQVNFSDKISIKISSKKKGTPEDLTAAATLFLNNLDSKCKGYVGKVQGKLDDKNLQETFDFVYNNLPLFLDKNDYAAIQNKIQNDSIATIVAADYKSLVSPTGIVSRDFILKDPLGISFIALKKMQQLSIGDDFTLQNGFLVTKNKQYLLLFVTPKLPPNETDRNTIFVEQLNTIKDKVNKQFKGKVALSFYGATPVAVGNATQIKADVKWTSIFAGVSLILMLIFFYRNITSPILIFIPSLFGAVFALAILYFTKGSISAISLGISSILLGETTDYSIYVLTHLRNNKDAKLLYKDITKPLILCGVTTSISFLCLLFVKSEALKDLGIFAALSVIATSVFSLVLIPLLYNFKIAPKENTLQLHKENDTLIDKIGAYSYHKNKFLILAMMVILIVCLFTYSRVTFNNDLASLNFISPELKQTEKELENITDGDSKSIYLASYGTDYETVLSNNNKLFEALTNEKKSKLITNFSSIGGLVFSKEKQLQKIQDWNTFWSDAKKELVKSRLINNGTHFGFKITTFNPFYERLEKKNRPILVTDFRKVAAFYISEFVSQKNGFYTISTLVKVSKDKRDAFVSAIQKQPNLVVIDRQQTNETFLGTLKDNFEKLINYSFIAILIILFLSFKRIELVIVGSIPIAISWIFTKGLMGAFDLQFNVINIIVCTLIFGIGVDYSIFMTTALQKEHTYGKAELPTYRTSILLSVATTILGIGVLIFAKHPALKSIALIGIVGIFSALLITFIIQPLVFNFFVTNPTKKGNPPFEIRRFLHSVLSFIYFGFGGLLLSLIGTLLIKIIPISRTKKLQAFHFIMSKFMHSVFLTYPSIKRKIINNHNENFQKPGVIIANHTSFLDILAIGMLSPKIIFLVSDWVYNSPFFGKGVRLAGFYPVSSGIDNGIEHLREKINQGFSIMVFPEATRSVDNSVKRFHKGAFYLAEQFNLDIIPIVIHGYSEVSPKGDFMLYKGSTTVEFLDRIVVSDLSFGKSYTERAKKINAVFKLHYRKMRLEYEGANYFKSTLLNSFGYKEREIIQAVKANINNHAPLFHNVNKYITANAKVAHFANDYGELDVLLSLQESQRKIISFIDDQEKRAVAKTNHFLKKRSILYAENVTEIMKNKHDVVLISNANFEFDIKEITNVCDSIILLENIENTSLSNQIIDNDFEIEVVENELIVLKKKAQ